MQMPVKSQKSARGELKTTQRIIYIAGPMAGLKNENRPVFAEAAETLRSMGYVVLNPAVLPTGMPRERYMPICLAMLEQADAIYLLRGWEDSRGAAVEYLLAAYQGKEILYE